MNNILCHLVEEEKIMVGILAYVVVFYIFFAKTCSISLKDLVKHQP